MNKLLYMAFCHVVFGWIEVENTIPDAVVTDHKLAFIKGTTLLMVLHKDIGFNFFVATQWLSGCNLMANEPYLHLIYILSLAYLQISCILFVILVVPVGMVV